MTASASVTGDQTLFDVAVVIPTVLRPSLTRAVRSVFGQCLSGRIQLLIGIDRRLGDAGIIERLAAERPPHVSLTVIDLGYSTSRQHGGFYSNRYSGALRTILSYAANSPYVAYLDDDDWWAETHLSSLLAAVAGKAWAFSRRWLVDAETGWTICRDEWDSLGPGQGINQERYGGFVSPSNLLLDKAACHFILPNWSLSPFADGTGEDRLVFAALRQLGWAASGQYTCFYTLSREAQRHPHHARAFAERRIGWISDPSQVDTIIRLAGQAERALQDHRPDTAIELCRAALRLNPWHADALRILSLAEAAAEHPANAVLKATAEPPLGATAGGSADAAGATARSAPA